MYKNGILYVEDFFEKKSNFRELGVHCNTAQAYINTDRTYMKYGWESTSDQRVEIFTRQNRSNIIVYKPSRNCLYELKSQVRSHNANSIPEFSENYRYNSVRYCNSNTKVCFDFRKYNYQNGIVGDYLLIYNKNELDINDLDNIEALTDEASIPSKMYESEDGRFKVNFLGATPEISTESVPTELGDIEITMFLYEKSLTEAYIIGYNDYPSAIVEAGSPANMLAGGKEGVINSMGVTHLDLEEEVSIDGHSGLHFKGVAGTMHVEYQMYLVGNRLYQIGVIRDGSYVKQDRVDTFFGTFELTD